MRLVRRAGLKVVVDLHLIPGGDERGPGMELVMEDPAMFDRYLRFTGRMAETLAREDPKAVSLELMNEPVSTVRTTRRRSGRHASRASMRRRARKRRG